ncbi:MAG: hypothetical protein CMN28_01570 [Salinisphaeraceae bacterium]|jgi:hypothetical protein|nr:hypothetical protein [Salinisphaeraceae bacterium]
MRHLLAATIFFVLVTAFFTVGLFKVQLKAIFSYHPSFGNPLTMTVMIKRTDGESIFNAETL